LGTPAESPKPASKFKEFADVTKDSKKHEGLFVLYEKDQSLYAEIRPSQLNQSFLAPIVIARGLASAGTPLNFGDEWIVQFRRVGDNLQLVRKNIHYEAPKDSPLQKAVEQNYTDSILLALPILSINPGSGGLLIDFGSIYLTDFARLGLGNLDRNRTSWQKIKTFPNNIELQVEATYAPNMPMGMMSSSRDDGVVDASAITLVIHYSLAKLPEDGYKPRLADQRVGYFISATKDFASKNPDTEFVRRLNRWRLEKADPKSPLSPPKQQLIWWVEDNVPHEYRPFVEEGILEWNKAFEKIGFRNAIGVRWQNGRDDFDPEDINYCTFRWITTPYTFAMSGLRAHPITGEMIDGDVIFDASWIRAWKEEYAFMVGSPVPTAQSFGFTPLDVGEIASPIMAIRHGYGLPFPLPHQQYKPEPLAQQLGGSPRQVVPSSWTPLQVALSRRLNPNSHAVCQCATAKRYEYRLAALAFAAREEGRTEATLPDRLIGQAIKEVVMHEVGHSLGLRHNFRASSMLSLDQINDTALTRQKGLVGSVMDYSPLNISRKGQPQGDYATTTIGPYDYWAIEYAYKPIDGDEAAELRKIAERSPEPDLVYATDEDLYFSSDPLVNAYDLGSDALRYGKDRLALAAELLKDIDEKAVRDGESWARLRSAFSVLLAQYGNAAYLASAYIGGQTYSRDYKGSKNARDPVTPIPGVKQRGALQFLIEEILSDRAFTFKPSLLRRLTVEHWYHWGNDSLFASGEPDYPVYARILGIQRIVLSQCFDSGVLQRLLNQPLLSEPDREPLRIDEVFRKTSGAIWSELNADPGAETISTIRRNLQRQHLRTLGNIVLGSSGNAGFPYAFFYGSARNHPEDARNLARMGLRDLSEQILRVMNSGRRLDDVTRAHLAECRNQAEKLLAAGYDLSRP